MENKSYKLLSLILALFIIMACSTLGGGAGEENIPVEEPASSEEGIDEESAIPSDETSSTASGLCTNEYYPVVEGGTWSYLGTSSATEDYSFTNTISSVRDNGFTVTVEFDEVTLVQEWACTPDGILALDAGGGAAGTVRTDDINLVMETQNASGITYPKEILPGDTWNHTVDYTGTMDMAGDTIEVSGNTEYNYTAIGVETISVSAGTFEAMKIDQIITVNINMVISGSEVPVTFTSTSTSWFAKDVGWIKSDSASDIGGFTTTESLELATYSIP